MPDYNGWANRETWSVWVWISGNKDLYHYSRLKARQGPVVLSISIGANISRGMIGLALDLMTDALNRVDWRSISEALLDDNISPDWISDPYFEPELTLTDPPEASPEPV